MNKICSSELYVYLSCMNHNIEIDSQTSNAFKVDKGVHQGCIPWPMLFKIHGEYIVS